MTENTITQADREAAAEWSRDLDPGMRSLLAAHFARHRIAAEEATKEATERATIEKVVGWLKSQPDGDGGDFAQGFAYAIERGEWK